MAELQRASVLAIKEETTVGELIEPTAGSDFIPLRPGSTIDTEFDQVHYFPASLKLLGL